MSAQDELYVNDIHSLSDIQLLDDIDNLRAHGIRHLVALPQLIVCGDQSSGKSSVLDAVSGIPFPSKDTLCTRFATEVVLRRAVQEEVKISILPGPSRDSKDAAEVQSFQHDLCKWESLEDAMNQAMKSMGLHDDAGTFTDDVLRIDISGPSKPHLTIVDLPGLIHTHGKSQTPEDVVVVQQLVRNYMANQRSIILAIVSAKNDYANQIVLKMAREVDPRGLRTLGIITKPDTLALGSESETAYLNLAKGLDIKFMLGWHVLKNRDYSSRAASLMERNQAEVEFLSQGVWAQLSRSDVTIAPLRRRLSRVLLSQIKKEVPNLLREIEIKLNGCKSELRRLGHARNTEIDRRRFLLRLSEEYRTLCRAAVDGVYGAEFFGNPLTDEGHRRRLRATVQSLSLELADIMRRQGHRYNLVDHERGKDDASSSLSQITMTRKQYIEHAKVFLTRSRGRELPGTFNPLLIADLFQEQCSLWPDLLREYLRSVSAVTQGFVRSVVRHLAQDEVAEKVLDAVIEPSMTDRISRMTQKGENIILSYQKGHPITYNHYFTETIQNVRAKRMESDLTERLRKFMGNHDVEDIEELSFTKLKKSSLISALSIRNEHDMDSYAGAEAVDCMLAYYKVAMKLVVDNVATQCVEDELMKKVSDLFSPTTVLEMNPRRIDEVVQESPDTSLRRETLLNMERILESGLETCRRYPSSHQDVKVHVQHHAESKVGSIGYGADSLSNGVRDSNLPDQYSCDQDQQADDDKMLNLRVVDELTNGWNMSRVAALSSKKKVRQKSGNKDVLC
ncbi:hypothetical protein LTR78_009353 [Recurvomyces mirabilis]|uniref:Uncharacterized protein n=1 Tax=Recurvomyces mirabilis TaxID=574656 RepID=A0AAE0TRT0_9PEZI|nr:hypothetical protein LTR78_009353 [Recurvomyces mirabilis]